MKVSGSGDKAAKVKAKVRPAPRASARAAAKAAAKAAQASARAAATMTARHAALAAARSRARIGGRKRASSAVFVLALVGATLAALGHVAVQAKTVEVAVALASAREQHEELLAEQRRLELLVGELKDPGRLMAEGRKRGMIATPAAIRVISPREVDPVVRPTGGHRTAPGGAR
jgi:cell division protein FtsL